MSKEPQEPPSSLSELEFHFNIHSTCPLTDLYVNVQPVFHVLS